MCKNGKSAIAAINNYPDWLLSKFEPWKMRRRLIATGPKKIDQFNRTIVDGLIQKDRQLNVDKYRPWKRSVLNLSMFSFFLIKSSTFGKFPKCLVHSTP